MVEIAAPASTDPGWAPVEDARGSTRFAGALTTYLAAYPHGAPAARALLEQAAREDDLVKAGSLLRRARSEGAGTEIGSQAALDLARLEYAQDHAEAALLILDDADAWPRPDAQQPEWLYWRAQCRLVLKGYQRARDDFRHVAAAWPGHARAEACLLGEADCDAALKDDDRAVEIYQKLAKGQGPFAAQALWGLAALRQRQGSVDEARRLFAQVQARFPASFESHAAGKRLDELAKAPAPTPTPLARPRLGRFYVQVGAFSRRASAAKLAARLKSHRFLVKVQPRKLDGRPLYLVKAGPYASRAKAETEAHKLETREKLPQRIVEE